MFLNKKKEMSFGNVILFFYVDLHMMFHCSFGFLLACFFFYQNEYAPSGPTMSLFPGVLVQT